jgi:hypothetical protein
VSSGVIQPAEGLAGQFTMLIRADVGAPRNPRFTMSPLLMSPQIGFEEEFPRTFAAFETSDVLTVDM